MNHVRQNVRLGRQRATVRFSGSWAALTLACLLVGPLIAKAASAQGTTIVQVRAGNRLITTVRHTVVSNKLSIRAQMADPPAANGIVNGDFADGLDGWTPVIQGGGGAVPGTIVPDNGQALLLEGDSFLVSLQQSFVLPGDARELTFDVIVDPGFDLTAVFIPDAFEVQLLDDQMDSVVPTWDPLATSFFNLQEDLTQNIGPGVTVTPLGDAPPAFQVAVDLSATAGPVPVTLFIDLIGADADTASGIRVDNFVLARRSDPPLCDAGAPYAAECQGRITSVPLDGSASIDPGGATLTYFWTVDCPAANFDDPASPTPILRTASAECDVTLTVDNGFGGVNTCSTTVTVADTTPPEIVCPGLYIVQTTSPAGIPVEQLPLLASAMDACDNAVEIATEPPLAGHFPPGDTVIRFTATDDAGNESACDTTVRVMLVTGDTGPAGGGGGGGSVVVIDPCVNDNTSPGIICLESVEVVSEADVPVGDVPLPVAAVDNCGDPILITDDRPADVYPLGESATVVTFTATDGDGNESTCQTTVRVMLGAGDGVDEPDEDPCANDSTPPRVVCLDTVEIISEADVPVGEVDLQIFAIDNCSGPVTIADDRPADVYPAAPATTLVTFTATDEAGNTATCQTAVTLIDVEAGREVVVETHQFVERYTTREQIVPAMCGAGFGPLAMTQLLVVWGIVGRKRGSRFPRQSLWRTGKRRERS